MSYYNPYLPNPMLKPDGTLVRTTGEWEVHKAYLRELAQQHMYGTWPGKVDALCAEEIKKADSFEGTAVREEWNLTVTYRGQTFPMGIVIYRPKDELVHPVVVCNQFSHELRSGDDHIRLLIRHGYALASFLMGDLVPDIALAQYFKIPIDKNRAYPKLPCRTIMAWAWGHSIVADYLEKRSFAGPLISSGASRGGKAALCAAIFDERFMVAAPTIAGCGGTGTARFCGTTDGSRQDSIRSETIGRITEAFPDWFHDTYASYGSHEEPFAIDEKTYAFPLDANVLRALVAPRAVFSSDGEEDHWSNPFGTQLAWMAAQPVFDFLGVPQNNGFNIRPGVHGLDIRDWEAMVSFCDIVLQRDNSRLCATLNQPYFKEVDITQYADFSGFQRQS